MRSIRSELRISGGHDALGRPKDVRGAMVVVRKAPNLLLSTTEIEGVGTIKQGFDGTNGWTSSPSAPAMPLHGIELAELAREARFDFGLDLRGAYPHAELVGPFKIHDAMCWHVHLASDSKGTADAYFDQQSGRCLALSRRLRSGGQVLQVTRYFRDYTEHDGIWLPSRIEQTVGDNEQVEVLQGVEATAIDDAAFAMPSAGGGR